MQNPSRSVLWPRNGGQVAAVTAERSATNRRAGKLLPGDTIRLPTPAHFKTTGVSADRFTVIEIRKRTVILAPTSHPNSRCRLRRATLATASVER